jgi:hypothetical protein
MAVGQLVSHIGIGECAHRFPRERSHHEGLSAAAVLAAGGQLPGAAHCVLPNRVLKAVREERFCNGGNSLSVLPSQGQHKVCADKRRPQLRLRPTTTDSLLSEKCFSFSP